MKRNVRKWMAMGLSLAMAATMFTDIKPVNMVKAAQSYGLQNPRTVSASEEPEPGQTPELKNPIIDKTGFTTWDCVYFGNYWQEDTNGDGKANQSDAKTPIKWRVLSVEDNDVFLMADKSLDVKKYHETLDDVTWETSSLRSWLNSDFMNHAFTEEEQAGIATTKVENKDNPDYKIDGGKDTLDKVYLLSVDEMRNPAYGFSEGKNIIDNYKRMSESTAYTKGGGEEGWSENNGVSDNEWLRTIGESKSEVCNVGNDGFISTYGFGAGDIENTVRPVLHLDLSTAQGWSYAGTFSTNEGASTWDCVYFGNYWQEDTNKDGKADSKDAKTPIKWRVLSVDGDDAFLLADKKLELKEFDELWNESELRRWLNGYEEYESQGFIDEAFTGAEQSAISITKVVDKDNSETGVKWEEDTFDKVYLASVSEVTNSKYGFSTGDGFSTGESSMENYRRMTEDSTYVKDVYAEEIFSAGAYRSDGWWLRSPGDESYRYSSCFVTSYGKIFDDTFCMDITVRPVLHLNLASVSNWSYAGTVSSDGSVDEVAAPSPDPTATPTVTPTATPTVEPTTEPTIAPTQKPTVAPTQKPTAEPTTEPTTEPTQKPTTEPTQKPTVEPTQKPTTEPTQKPTTVPSQKPTLQPTPQPTSPSTQNVNPGNSSNLEGVVTSQTPAPSELVNAKVIGVVKGLKVTMKKRQAKVSWKKVSGVQGYQICYSTSKKFKNKKQLLAKNNKVTLKKLKSGKTYFVKVRAYTLDGKKKVYGKWSKVMNKKYK